MIRIAATVIFIGYMDTKVDSNRSPRGKIVVALPGRKADVRDTSITPRQRFGFIRPFPGSIATFIVADDSGSQLDGRTIGPIQLPA